MKTLKTLFAAAGLVAAAMAPFAAHAGTVLKEGFNNPNSSGWTTNNASTPAGGVDWFQGNPGIFGAQGGPNDSYMAANFLSAANGSGSVDNWLISPVLDLSGASTLSFFTRSSGDGVPDLLEVRFSSGTGLDPNGFGTLLLTVGSGGYPNGWQQFSSNFSFDGAGRIAFRYLGNADDLGYIGIDTVQVMTAVPEPSLSLMLGFGLGALGLMRRKLGN